MDLNVTTRRDGDRIVIAVAGEIDIYTAPTLREQLDEVIHDGTEHVVVDLNQVSFMDSTGLSVLISAYRQLNDNGSVQLICGHERLLKVFRITGTDRIFTIYASEAQALRGEPVPTPPPGRRPGLEVPRSRTHQEHPGGPGNFPLG